MARLGGFSTEKAAQDYGFSRQAAANRFREQEIEAANQALEEQLQKIQDEASKKSKRGGGFGANLLKGLVFGALGPAGAALQLLDSVRTGILTDKDYKKYIDDLRELGALDSDTMKRFEGTPLESILANAVGQASMEGEQSLQGARGAARTGNILDAVLSGISLGQGMKASKAAKAITPFDVAPPLTGDASNVLPYAPKNLTFLDKAANTGTDALEGILKTFGGKQGGQVAVDAANLVTEPVTLGIPRSNISATFNPYSLLRAGKAPLMDYLIGQPGDISFNEIDAPRRRIR